jgi:hypothetical protein
MDLDKVGGCHSRSDKAMLGVVVSGGIEQIPFVSRHG